jgi:hypothetical protein
VALAHELAVKEALRALDAQQRSLDSIQARASHLLAAGLVSLGFLAGIGLDDPGDVSDRNIVTVVASAVAFVAAIWFVVRTLWPASGTSATSPSCTSTPDGFASTPTRRTPPTPANSPPT